jgi:Ca2+-binding EF-hand superfamily protein
MAFLEKREEETQGAFSQDARKDYLSELKAQMDGQKADRRMEKLRHWGWNTGPPPDPRRKIFEKFDYDGSGTLTIEELKKVVRHPRVIAAFQLPHSMTHEELEEFCEEIDINGDGVIDFEEFIQFIDAKAGERVQGPVDLTHGPGSHSLRKLKNEL